MSRRRAGSDVASSIWPAERSGEAIGMLGSVAGLISPPTAYPAPPAASRRERGWVSAAAEWLGVEAEPTRISFSEVERALRRLAPALVETESGGYLAVIGAGRRHVELLDPEHGRGRLPIREVARELRRPARERHGVGLERLLAAVPTRRQALARDAIVEQRLQGEPIATAWVVRLPPSAPLLAQAREAGLPGLLLRYLGAYTCKMVIWLGAWWVLWRGALAGQADWGWLAAWVLLQLSHLPFRLIEPWYSNLFGIGLGWLVKRGLLAGAMRLEPEEIRHQGTGQLLSRSLEGEAAEKLTLDAGASVAGAILDLLLALPILWLGASGPLHAVLLLLWLGASLLFLLRFYRWRKRWTERRLDATHRLVEQMVGHSTRLVQEPEERRHEGEDEELDGYLRLSRRMDAAAALLSAAVPGGWLVLSLLLLLPVVVVGGFSSTGLALAVGGVLFSLQSLDLITSGLLASADVAVVWQKLVPLLRAARRPRVAGLPELALGVGLGSGSAEAGAAAPVVEGTDLVFGYRGRPDKILRGCDVRIERGERLLLEGPSGGGKSTLLSLVLGLRAPDSGLLLLGGLDRPSLGEEGWRRRVAAAPQFHENHVFLGTFAFNLLMGREWPPTAEDFREAETVCRDLGLGELIERMPGGLVQQVGETGWQLSHGERSRLYIARALLQNAELVAFDESFAALDPENVERALGTVVKRVETVVVVAHP